MVLPKLNSCCVSKKYFISQIGLRRVDSIGSIRKIEKN
jgi:hypothetical protein